MSQDMNHDNVSALDAYLDGMMSDAHRRDFESRLRDDPSLREAVEAQRAIDESMKRAYAAPSPSAALKRLASSNCHSHARSADASTTQAPIRRLPLRFLALAAAVVLAVGGVWIGRTLLRETSVLVVEYRAREASGWKEDWVCPPKQFAVTHFRRLGRGLMLAEAPVGVTALGLAYADCMSKRTIYLVATVDGIGIGGDEIRGAKVAVFVDRAENDPGLEGYKTDGLQVFRRELGPLVLYEVTPLDRPHILDLYGLFDVPAEWLQSEAYAPPKP